MEIYFVIEKPKQKSSSIKTNFYKHFTISHYSNQSVISCQKLIKKRIMLDKQFELSISINLRRMYYER